MRRELVEEVESSVGEGDEATSNGEAGDTTYNTTFQGSTAACVSTEP